MRYLYLDYGGLPKYRRELKYSLIGLRQDAPDALVAVYTDAPALYANWPVAAVDIPGGWPNGRAGGFTITASSRRWRWTP